MSNSSSPVLSLHVLSGKLYSTNSDAFTKKHHVPYLFFDIYNFNSTVYEYVNPRYHHWMLYRGLWEGAQMAQQVQSPALGAWLECTCQKTPSILESIHLPPVFSLTQLEVASLQHPRHLQCRHELEGWILRKWQAASPKKLNYLLLSGQPFCHSLAVWHLQAKWQNRSYQTNNGVFVEVGSITAN